MIAAFLERYRPGGPWQLVSITPDKKQPPAAVTFLDAAQAETWALASNKTANVYFAVNAAFRSLNKKAEKADIARVEFFHVDLDPRIGEDLQSERERIQKRLNGSLSDDGIPPPSLVIDTGGGFAAYWRLAEAIEVNGDPDKIAEAERYNIELANRLGGDHCHDVSRIMRCPGTRNWPDKKKRERGRVPVDAEVYDWPAPEPYPLSAFTPAPITMPLVNGKATRASTRLDAIPLHGGIGLGVDELTAWASENSKTLKGSTLALIATGADPIEPGKHGSRSEVLFRACCDLVRADVPDDVIYKVITGPNAIAESVKDKPDPRSYALRQIERAKDRAVASELMELNDQHAVLLQEGGKTRILSWERTELDANRLVPVLQSFEDFRNRYMHRFVEYTTANGLVRKPLGEWWLKQARRREYLALRFYPGQPEEVDGCLNLWRGFTVQPVSGDWALMRQHVVNVLADGSKAYADYILRWAAWAVQNPAEPAEVALVLRGGRGTGKGIFARALKRLFGQHGLQVNSPAQLTGRFNAHLRDCCLLFADEAIIPGDKAAESVLKGLITEPELTIEGKGVNLVQARNRLHVVMASNEDWVVPAGIDERRFAVFEVSSAHAQDEDYFKPLSEQLESGGLAAMLHDLLAMDLSGWHPRRNVPQTKALLAQKAASLDGFEAYVYDMLSTDGLPITGSLSTGADFVATEELRDAAVTWLRSRRGEQHVTNQKIAELMEQIGCKRYRRGGGGQHGFRLASLSKMRENWDATKFPGLWGTPVERGEEEASSPPF